MKPTRARGRPAPALAGAPLVVFAFCLPAPAREVAGMTQEQASSFARLALESIRKEYPNKPGHVLDGEDDVKPPRALHPAFYGSYDWHSAVHMHWLLVRIQRLYPKKRIAERLARHLTPKALRAELAYFNSAAGRTFERPYGWAWLLELQAELIRLGNTKWSDALQPLAAELARRMARFVAGAPYPIRAGSHGNTAFACLLAVPWYVLGQQNDFATKTCLPSLAVMQVCFAAAMIHPSLEAKATGAPVVVFLVLLGCLGPVVYVARALEFPLHAPLPAAAIQHVDEIGPKHIAVQLFSDGRGFFWDVLARDRCHRGDTCSTE